MGSPVLFSPVASKFKPRLLNIIANTATPYFTCLDTGFAISLINPKFKVFFGLMNFSMSGISGTPAIK